MKSFSKFAFLLLLSAVFTHVSFSQNDQPRGHDPTCVATENQTVFVSHFSQFSIPACDEAAACKQVDPTAFQVYAYTSISAVTASSKDLPSVIPLQSCSSLTAANLSALSYKQPAAFQVKYLNIISTKTC